MNREQHCTAHIDPDTVHRYVAGTLDEAQVDEFEIHLLTCAACQADVRSGAAVAAALAAQPTHRALQRRTLWRWAVPLAAAATLVIVMQRGGDIEQLGGVSDAPSFEALPVRNAATAEAQLADSGFAAYARGDHARAAELLAQATREPDSGVAFFLGMSRLMSGDERGAIDALRTALHPAGNVYEAEAHFYLAKAWLRAGAADSALSHLGRIPASDIRVGAHARALADSVRARRSP